MQEFNLPTDAEGYKTSAELRDGKIVTPISIDNQDVLVAMDLQAVNIFATVEKLGTGTLRQESSVFAGTNKDLKKYTKKVLRIDNTHDQPVKVILKPQNLDGNFTRLDKSDVSITIPAGALNLLITEADWDVLGYPLAEPVAFRITKDVAAPTSGKIDIYLYGDTR
ncbi:hypothetical protein HCA69_02365 [Listeria grandensis]|uniref:Uncharacterized protein n=1 Tax=Listeria grandensis TaxID=1494963 RepID=A0A7X0Y220_9LIST|nr:hypothetical protein [Listeria grandensis]MBC1935194.1 hypothetical protein [Listeria grandensis]